MAVVMIGVDPHKGSHTAVAIGSGLDAQMRESQKKLAVAVKASGTTLTGLFGVGPFVAATVIGDAADVVRFESFPRLACGRSRRGRRLAQ